MKKLLLILLFLPFIGFGQNVNIPDPNFKAYLVGNTAINTNGDSEIQLSEATSYNGSINIFNSQLYDLTGIEAFISLDYLMVDNAQVSSIDLSQNTLLTYLKVVGNPIINIDLSQNTLLETFIGSYLSLTSLDVSQNLSLKTLWIDNNQIINIDLSQNLLLENLNIANNGNMSSIDLSNNTNLSYLKCYGNNLDNLDLSYKNNLEYLDCSGNIMLSDINLSYAYNLKHLNCSSSLSLSNLDLSYQNNFDFLDCSVNPYLSCILVSNPFQSIQTWTYTLDPQQYFSDNCGSTDVQEHTTNKELLKVTEDLLGREIKANNNEFLFYIYDDGTVEKKLIIE
tara:strand:+ start:4120 stop:5133 length:1014 start_codon:yes stop_codon:yes gene_type:complete